MSRGRKKRKKGKRQGPPAEKPRESDERPAPLAESQLPQNATRLGQSESTLTDGSEKFASTLTPTTSVDVGGTPEPERPSRSGVWLWLVERLSFRFVFGISFCVGLIQAGIAVFSHLHVDSTVKDYEHDFKWFGYFTTAYWSFGSLCSVPIGYACSVVGLRRAFELLPTLKARFLILCCAAFATVALVTARDVHRNLTSIPKDYIQWTHLNTKLPVDNPSLRAARATLYFLGTLHVMGSFFCFLALLMTTAFAMRCVAKLPQIYWTSQERVQELLVFQKTGMGALFFYYVLLRTSKVEMLLAVRSPQPPAEKSVLKFAENAQPYFEAISSSLQVDLTLLVIWIFLLFLSHRYLYIADGLILNTDQLGVWIKTWVGSYEKLEAPFKIILGLSMIAIILPPPSRLFLLQLMVAGAGLLIFKSYKKGSDGE